MNVENLSDLTDLQRQFIVKLQCAPLACGSIESFNEGFCPQWQQNAAAELMNLGLVWVIGVDPICCSPIYGVTTRGWQVLSAPSGSKTRRAG